MERELIPWLRQHLPPHLRLGLGDDAAVLRMAGVEELSCSSFDRGGQEIPLNPPRPSAIDAHVQRDKLRAGLKTAARAASTYGACLYSRDAAGNHLACLHAAHPIRTNLRKQRQSE
jgi:hypothetical protein